MWAISLVLTLAAGWMMANALAGRAWTSTGPAWAIHMTSAGLAILFGPGLYSVIFFGLTASGNASAPVALGLAVLLAAINGAAWWKYRDPSEAAVAERGRFPFAWALWIGLAIGAVLVFMDFRASTVGNPDGDWDASGIWNLRARFLASGAAWPRALSAEIGGFMTGSSHPGYPLFLSSVVAGLWTIAGGFLTEIPSTMSILIALGVVMLLVGSLAARFSPALGLLAGLVLLTGELLASQAAAQYSDLLQSLSFLGALVLLEAASRERSPRLMIAAGLAIGFAPWIKNEGQPFAIAALAVAAWQFRGQVLWVLVGAFPGFAATAALKLLAEGREAMFPATMGAALSKIADPGRWIQIVTGFGKALFDAGPVWAHPILLLAALAIVLRFVPAEDRTQRWWLWVPIVATLAAEFGLYLITTADLTWHISTSVTRLVAQVWPSLLWLFFSTLRAPEEYFAVVEPAAVPVAAGSAGRKKKQR